MRLIDGVEVDKALAWPIGHADRLAKRRKLPHVVLPDGAIRFRWSDIGPLIVERLARKTGVTTGQLLAERQVGTKDA